MAKTNKNSNTRQLVELIAKAAESKNAIDLKILDIRKVSSLVDFLIICSAESLPQLRAIEKEIDSQLRKSNIKGFRWEGLVKSGWVVLDLGAIAIHVMGVEERKYYNLEDLWGKEAIIYHY
jgi:ribosome-associated protein